MSAEDRFDRASNPELSGLFDALDGLVREPADPALRTEQIQRAALLARTSEAATPHTGWHLRRAVAWRVAAAAAAVLVVFAGLGADDRLPAPAQRVASSIAGIVGIELPDASHRDDPVEPHEHEGTSRRSSTVPAEPAEPGEPGEPADPATSAEPDGDSGVEPSTPDAPTTPDSPGTAIEPTQPDKPEKPPPTTTTPPTTHTSPTPPTTPTTGAPGDRSPAEEPSTRRGTTPENAPDTAPESREQQGVSADPGQSDGTAK